MFVFDEDLNFFEFDEFLISFFFEFFIYILLKK